MAPAACNEDALGDRFLHDLLVSTGDPLGIGEYGVPSPAVVAAWDRVGKLPVEKVPLWAAYWIAAGYDGEELVYLAGLHGDDPLDVRDALPGALADCGVTMPDSDAAAAILVFTQYARMYLSGQASALWVAQKVDEVLIRCDYARSVLELPLGSLFGINAAWDAGSGRSEEQFAARVLKACERQLRMAR